MYATKPGANTYKETRIKTASGARLIVMLYDEALKQLTDVIAIYKKGATVDDYATINNGLNKTLDIIGELSASLDFEQGGTISPNLYNLYQFFNNEITNSNMQKKLNNLEEVQRMMTDLREAWNAIDAQKPTETNQRSFTVAG